MKQLRHFGIIKDIYGRGMAKDKDNNWIRDDLETEATKAREAREDGGLELRGRLVAHEGYGRHIKVIDQEGKGYSTKNIAPFGARTLFDADMIHGKGAPIDLDLRKRKK